MAIDASTGAAPPVQAVASTVTTADSAAFEQRWAAWQARGAAHDRAARRHAALAAPVVLILAAVVYALFGR